MARKLTTSLISRFAPATACVGIPKHFVTAGRPLHKEKSELNDAESIKELAEAMKNITKQDPKTMEKVTEAAEAVKEGAKEVRRTSEFIRDTTKAATKSVTEMSKTLTDRVIDVAENATGTPNGTISMVVGAAQKVKEVIVGKK